MPDKPEQKFDLGQAMDNFFPEPVVDTSVLVAMNLLCCGKTTAELGVYDRYFLLDTAQMILNDENFFYGVEPGLAAIFRLLGLDPDVSKDEINRQFAAIKSNLPTNAW